MHPDILRDIDQKVHAGLITLMDAKILNKYLADRQISKFYDLPGNDGMTWKTIFFLALQSIFFRV